MELTQLNGVQVWKKIPLNNNLHKLSPDWSAWWKLEHFAEIEKKEWNDRILKPINDAHVEINWKKIDKTHKLNLWDTISTWKKKENIFAVHSQWKILEKKEVEEHLDKAWQYIWKEELEELMEKLERDEKLIRWAFIALFFVTFIFTWIIFYLWSTNSTLVWKVNNLIVKQEAIESIRQVIWEREEDMFWTWSVLTLVEELDQLKEKNTDLENQIKWIDKAEDAIKKINTQIEALEVLAEEPGEVPEEVVISIKDEVLETTRGLIDVLRNGTWSAKVNSEIKEIQKNLDNVEEKSWKDSEKVLDMFKVLIERINVLQSEIKTMKDKTEAEARIKAEKAKEAAKEEKEKVVCTMEYAPKCGQSASKNTPQTYSNDCMLNADWAKFLYHWECKDN